VIPGEGVFILSDRRHTLLQGPALDVVVPLIDGVRSADEIVDLALTRISAAEAYHALALLDEQGLLEEADAAIPPGEAALWALQGLTSGDVRTRVHGRAVRVSALGGLPTGPLQGALAEVGFVVEEPASLDIVLADDYLRPELATYNQLSIRTGTPWMLVRPVGGQLWVGPLFVPARTACWACLAERLRLNRSVESYVRGRLGRDHLPISRAAAPPTTRIAADVAALEAARFFALDSGTTVEGRLVSLDIVTWTVTTHVVVRLPHCPACGHPTAAADDPTPPRLSEDAGAAPAPGLPGRAPLVRFAHHLSPITGLVNQLVRCSVTDALHVYVAGENAAIRHDSVDVLAQSVRSRCVGKGTTEAEASTGAFCEALERYSGIFQGREPRRRGTFRALAPAAVHPNACMGFSERQYRNRDWWNGRGSRFNVVPLPFDENRELEWTPVWSVTHAHWRYLPTAYCYFGYQAAPGDRSTVACSNGNAAGTSLADALVRGFLELVERDAVAIWWYNRLRRPALDLNTLADPYVARLLEFLDDRGRDVWLLDLTTDLEVPAFAAVTRRRHQPEEQILMGFGAHLDGRTAALRALTELSQMLACVYDDHGRDVPASIAIDDPETLDWLRTATVEAHPYLTPDPAAASRSLPGGPSNSRAWPVSEAIDRCRASVERLGMEVLVLDQTRPDVGLPVAKVFVPGLRHYFARFGPGRLYDVPVTLGWRAAPLPETELNPIPMFA